MPNKPTKVNKESAENVQRVSKGMFQGNSPLDTPQDSYRYLLNGVDATDTETEDFISNERGNIIQSSLPIGYYFNGGVYIGDGEIAIWAINPQTGRELIGIFDRNNNYNSIVDTAVLGLRITKQIDATYRLRRGKEKIVYWVNGKTKIKTFNFSAPQDFYTSAYRTYIQTGGNPSTYSFEKWDGSSFDLVKAVDTIPIFSDIEITDGGNIPAGGYSFAIQYIDEDLNPTHWLTTSNSANIFNDSTDKPYFRVRGSKNVKSDSQSFIPANKSIKLTLANLDTNFPFYRVGILQANGATGKVIRALASEIISTATSTYIYSGDDTSLQEVPLNEIELSIDPISSPEHIDQLENRLLVANSKGSKYNWCDFQKYASKISTNLATKEIVLNSVEDVSNQKNVKSSFQSVGYMPGEAYSLGIVYLVDDEGTIIESPVCHIPGRNATSSSVMKYYETNSIYNDIHNCLNGESYWGLDSEGVNLKGAKVRHHKFPTRNDVSSPLISSTNSTVSVDKYILTFKLELNTPTVTAWPLDSSSNPVVIAYTVYYQPTYATAPYAYNGYLSIDDLGQDIVVYDDINIPMFVSGTDYLVFEATSELIAVYQPGPDTFVITQNSNSYTAETIQNATISHLFGLEFSGVEKPHPDVVGFYIVRNKREDGDRNIIDNVILGLNTKSQQYKSFGLFMPKVLDTSKDDTSNWFWSPEHQFLKKKLNFTGIDIQGVYEESSKQLSRPESKVTYITSGGAFRYRRALIVEDVYPGTSYNAEVHKKRDKDDDGFSLVVGYRNYMASFSNGSGGYTLPDIDQVLYLDSCASKTESDNTYYNTSCDNKIGMVTYSDAIDVTQWANSGDNKISRLLYASLTKDNKDSYADFITRPYYKEHNNPFMFGSSTIVDGAEVFNGDAYISPATIVNTVFWEQRIDDRDKKDKTWQIVAGVILVIAGLLLAVFTAGTSLAVTAAGLASLAISYGVSIAMSGIKFETMKSMIDNDYPKGLKDTIKDQDNVYLLDGNLNYPGPLPDYADNVNADMGDDAFIWFSDRLSNIWIESTIPYGIRSGVTTSIPDFIDSPNPEFNEDEFRNYLTDKFTIIDRDRGSGRLYKGYPSAEFYDINLDYMRKNEEKLFYHLPIEYNCCNKVDTEIESFPMRIHYSQQSFQEERTDNYRVFLPNNYRDIEGENGEITDLFKIGNKLYISTTEGLWLLPQNLQQQTTDNGLIVFIGTGDFFNIPPIKISDSKLGSGGTKHKWATNKTDKGVILVSEAESKVYHFSGELSPISDMGMQQWFKNNLKSFLGAQFSLLSGIEFPNSNNPYNPEGVGIHSVYDGELDRILITKRDYLIRAEYQSGFRFSLPSDFDTEGAFDPTLPATMIFDIDRSKFGIVQNGIYRGDIALSNPLFFENKSWTISFSFKYKVWRSFHSYLPLAYLEKQQELFSLVDSGIWKHNVEGSYHTFYGQNYPHILEYVAINNLLITKVWDDITLQSIAKRYDIATRAFYDVDVTFNKLIASNSRQSTPEVDLVKKDGDSENYYADQVSDSPSSIIITRRERNWNINTLRDYRINYNLPIFSTSWLDIQGSYPIDKVLNLPSIDITKDWTELESLRDKYLVVRLIFDNFVDVSLTTNYIIDTEPPSM